MAIAIDNAVVGGSEDEAQTSKLLSDQQQKWLKKASDTYRASTAYLDQSVRSQWETSLFNFRSETKQKKTSGTKMFRPKIRSAIRTHEAALAIALFTNNDITAVSGANKNDPLQAESAKLNQALMQHRLDKTIPWFSTVLGAFQDAHVYGVCISKTYWRYEENKEGATLEDKPVIDILAPENFRFDPNSDWRDPVSSSPFLIEQIQMYAGEVLEKMGSIDPKTLQPEWHDYPIEQILKAGRENNTDGSPTRLAREGERTDPTEIDVSNEFKQVWVHFNIYKENGSDYAFFTLGSALLLSDPVPLEEYFQQGREVYTFGVTTIEAHRNYPAGSAELGKNLQREINTLADQRYQNVRLVLNKRYLLRRNGQIDTAALMRNVPGGGIMVGDPVTDVKVIPTEDVTSSSYQEQDRLNMDIDELMGTFSPSTVQSNRAMNETVGGMNLMNSGANAIQEYVMMTFIKTWVAPVMQALIKIEQLYETDETILAIAADKAGVKEQLEQAYGDPDALDNLIQQDLTLTVNVGMGNTSPEQKLQRLLMAVQSTAEMPNSQEKTNWDEVIKEVYAFAGYGDGDRFLLSEDEMAQNAQNNQQEPVEVLVERERNQIKLQIQEKEIAAADLKNKEELALKRELEFAKIAATENLTLSELETKIGIEETKDATKRDVEALKSKVASREMDLKTRMGSGI